MRQSKCSKGLNGRLWLGSVAVRRQHGAVAPIMFLVSCLVGGCVYTPTPTLSRAECETGDWRYIGYADGLAGRAPERFVRHREACASYGVTPDRSVYNEGRAEGLREYCTVPNGLQLGRRGGNCGICIGYLSVLDACRHGKKIHNVETAIADANGVINKANRTIASARAWTPEDELLQLLDEVDEQIAAEQHDISREISRNHRRIEVLRMSDNADEHKDKIDTLNRLVGELRERQEALHIDGEKRRRIVQERHKLAREDLVAENERALASGIEAKARGERSRAALEQQLSTLLKIAENLTLNSQISVESPTVD